MADPNVGVLLSTTLKKYRKNLTDNIHRSNAVWKFIKDNGGMRTEDGGERIVEPLMYGKNTTAGSYDGYDPLDTTPQTGIDSAEFNWKQYSVSVSISGREERQNGGSSRIVNLLEAKIKQAELSLTEQLTAGLFSNGTGNGSKDLTGLEAMVLNSGTYGGINSAAPNVWWQAGVETTSEALGLARMRTGFNAASVGGQDTPDLIVTTQSLFESYESLGTNVAITNGGSHFITPSMGTKKTMDLGIQSADFKGVPIVWDEQCPSGTMYLLNTKHMKLVTHKDANFETTDYKQPENQDAKVSQILFMGNLTCNRRKSFYKLTAKT
jgi:hypothetical protein